MFFRAFSALAALLALLLNGFALSAQERKNLPEARDTISVNSNETLASLRISGKLLYLAGRIRGDVHATNCKVWIRPGGKIEGTLYLNGGSLQNETKEAVRVASPLLSASASAAPETIPAPRSASANVSTDVFDASVSPVMNTNLIMNGTAEESVPAARPQSRAKWLESQLALLILGLLAGAAVRLAAPRAASRAARTVGTQPGRCLLVGASSGVALGVVSLLNAGLTQSPIKAMWLPFGFVVATGALVLLGFGWLCGMRAMGEWVAAKAGRDNDGDFFVRLALGLCVFFLANSILGGIGSWLGAIGLLTQLAVSVMGLGAAVITGLGRSDNWLGVRMNGGKV